MKNTILSIIGLILLLGYSSVFCEFNEGYYYESVTAFINSPNQDDIENIEDDNTRYCEQVYLEATRRRDYTEEELKLCSDIFDIKNQQEIDYKNYVLGNRGIYN